MAHGLGESIRRAMVPIHREGYPYIAGFLALTVVLWLLWAPAGWVVLGLTIWCTLFFRDPVRVTPLDPTLAFSPADGRVAMVDHAVVPSELGLGEEIRPRVSIFMSVFDVHVNRAPVAGAVSRMVYRPGRFLNAEDPQASVENERNGIIIETPTGPMAVVQIAGLVARRIVPFVREGDSVGPGDRIGLIRFGSRLDVYLPAGSVPLVAEGQRAVAGETPIADLTGARPQPIAVRTL